MEAAPNGVQGNKGVFTVMDSLDQPRLKGQGRMRRTRFSIRRHLQKHGLASANSDSDLEDEEAAEREWHTHTHTQFFSFLSEWKQHQSSLDQGSHTHARSLKHTLPSK